ncbi:MAG: hypothetical protein M1G31_10610 [Pseudanabaena sp. Salubria-1]|nr:hypothetical protein [Pseudanabaena sp. Salubria-1]
MIDDDLDILWCDSLGNIKDDQGFLSFESMTNLSIGGFKWSSAIIKSFRSCR